MAHSSGGSVHQQEHHDRRTWQNKDTYFKSARKQRVKRGTRKGDKLSKAKLSVIHLFQPGSTKQHSQLRINSFIDKYGTPMIQSPSQIPTAEHLRLLGNIQDLNPNRSLLQPSSRPSVQCLCSCCKKGKMLPISKIIDLG